MDGKAMELVAGGVVGVAFAELFKTFSGVIKTIVRFKATFKSLESTILEIAPIFKDIEESNKVRDRPPEETYFFKDQLEEGTKLILLCSDLKSWHIHDKYKYSKKLQRFNASLINFFQIHVQAFQVRGIQQVLDGVTDVKEILEDVLEKIDFISSSKYTGSAYIGEIPELTVGLELPLEHLKVMLLKDNDLVVLLSAPPGCGKTTLANMVCLDTEIKEKFKENIFFVTVSRTANIKIIVETIFKQRRFPVERLEFQNDEDAINQLRQLLKQIGGGPDKDPILLVLDDVWSPGLEAFVLKFMFRGIPKYKILVTSRSDSTKFQSAYKLDPLNYQDAKDLFLHWAFPPGNNHPAVSDEIVQKVVEACKRFPLALKLIGLSLYGSREVIWETKLDTWSNQPSTKFDSHSELLDKLKASLDALDEEKGMETVKEGFLDLGSFPEDQRISATLLLDIWVELYKLDENGMHLDENGMHTFSRLLELSTRNLLNFVPTSNDSVFLKDWYCNGQFVTLHDMLRELAIHQCGQGAVELRKKLMIEIKGEAQPEDYVVPLAARLVSISTDDTFISKWCDMELPEAEVLILNFRSKSYSLPQFMQHMKKLKVLIVTNYGFSPAELDNFPLVEYLSSLKRIRLEHVSICSTLISALPRLQKLSLTMCEIDIAFDNCAKVFPNLVEIEIDYSYKLVELPVGICDIVHLQKISITRCNELLVLPKDIGKLTNLQSLRLTSCTKLKQLPETIGCLKQLSLLDISDCLNLGKLPDQIGELQGLRKLHMRGCSELSLPDSVENLENLTVFCDTQNVALWKIYKKVVVKLVKEDKNLNWLKN